MGPVPRPLPVRLVRVRLRVQRAMRRYSISNSATTIPSPGSIEVKRRDWRRCEQRGVVSEWRSDRKLVSRQARLPRLPISFRSPAMGHSATRNSLRSAPGCRDPAKPWSAPSALDPHRNRVDQRRQNKALSAALRRGRPAPAIPARSPRALGQVRAILLRQAPVAERFQTFNLPRAIRVERYVSAASRPAAIMRSRRLPRRERR